ncbi:hypothetical protein DH2020_036631 [Rehmannia glutinosa]|uniref:DNA-directed RNA polymerase III subunit RPC5 n=1 Tax=Rehmannia glutinosa TaxID=99300 RepID=A0ABR0V409_REHGL
MNRQCEQNNFAFSSLVLRGIPLPLPEDQFPKIPSKIVLMRIRGAFMADMDLDELLDGPSKGPNRPARFAPKGSKFKPRPKAEPSQSLPLSASDSMESLPIPKKEELGIKSDIKPEYVNDAIEMDVEVKLGVKEEEKDDLMETELYVLQYPLRPLWRPYELDESCKEVRVKPASAEVEIDLAVDVDSKNYDPGADPRVQMKKQVCHLDAFSYLKLYLNPIHTVVQLRPSVQHLESRESKRKTVGSSNVNDTVKSEEPQEGKPSGSSKKPSRPRTVKRDDYLNSLCPGAYSGSFSSKGPSIRFLLTLPLRERFRTWLLELLEQGPPVHRFEALKHLAPDESVEEVLGVLQDHARVVQGLWVPKSPLVYGIDQGIAVLARDYVLLFSKNAIIHKSQLPTRPTLANAMIDVLNVLAVERDAFKDWKLRELPDLSFVKSNPSVVKKQEEEWECLEKRINDHVCGGRNRPSMRSSNTTNNPAT